MGPMSRVQGPAFCPSDQVLTLVQCYTAAPQVYTFILHLPDTDSPPSSLDLKLLNVHASGECPRNWYEPGDRLFLPSGISTAVEVKLPTRIEGWVASSHLVLAPTLHPQLPLLLAPKQ